jgi:hypothetical protein
MKKMWMLFLCCSLAMCLLAGCSVNPSEVSKDYAKEFVSKATYVKDNKTGMCFAVTGTRKTGDVNQNGISFTWVPCEQAEKFIEK